MNHYTNYPNKKGNSIRILALFLILTYFSSCDSFVEVALPSSQLTGDLVFKDKNTANAALIDIYAKMRDNGLLSGNLTGTSTSLGLYADELNYYGPVTDTGGSLYNNTLMATDANVMQIWNITYGQIYAANSIIAGMLDAPISKVDRDQLIAEGLFIRSLLYFYLTNTFGDVPYITSTDYRVNSIAPRVEIQTIYASIIADLKLASSLIQENYQAQGRVRPNRATVNALLARVYLYTNQWEESVSTASAVLNQSEYSLELPIAQVFLKESPSTIWQFGPKFEGNNTDFGITFIFNSGPPPFVALTEGLINAFEENDQRKLYWTTAVTNNVKTWYYSSKYTQNGFTGVSIEYPIVFRIQEQYLIRAEGNARLGRLTEAKEDLDKVRIAAGLIVTNAVTQQEIIDAILRERRVEFFCEYGSRFYDLKRTGNLNEALSTVKLGWNVNDALFPIPENEILINPNLKPQNSGY